MPGSEFHVMYGLERFAVLIEQPEMTRVTCAGTTILKLPRNDAYISKMVEFAQQFHSTFVLRKHLPSEGYERVLYTDYDRSAFQERAIRVALQLIISSTGSLQIPRLSLPALRYGKAARSFARGKVVEANDMSYRSSSQE